MLGQLLAHRAQPGDMPDAKLRDAPRPASDDNVTGLRVYISWLTTTGYTYGALAAPIAFLLAAFFIGLAIVLGAHFNAAIQHYWPKRLRDRRNVVPQPHLP